MPIRGEAGCSRSTSGDDPGRDERRPRGRADSRDGARLAAGRDADVLRRTAPSATGPRGNTSSRRSRIRMVVSEHPNAPGPVPSLLDDVRVVEHHWLDQDRLVALVAAQVAAGRLARPRRGVRRRPALRVDRLSGEFSRISGPARSGPTTPSQTDTLRLYDLNGNVAPAAGAGGQPRCGLVAGRAAGWRSPLRRACTCSRPGRRSRWSGSRSSPTTSTGEARPARSDSPRRERRAWLARVRPKASGRLVVTVAEETAARSARSRSRPHLVAEDAAPGRGPCRFTLGPRTRSSPRTSSTAGRRPRRRRAGTRSSTFSRTATLDGLSRCLRSRLDARRNADLRSATASSSGWTRQAAAPPHLPRGAPRAAGPAVCARRGRVGERPAAVGRRALRRDRDDRAADRGPAGDVAVVHGAHDRRPPRQHDGDRRRADGWRRGLLRQTAAGAH